MPVYLVSDAKLVFHSEQPIMLLAWGHPNIMLLIVLVKFIKSKFHLKHFPKKHTILILIDSVNICNLFKKEPA